MDVLIVYGFEIYKFVIISIRSNTTHIKRLKAVRVSLTCCTEETSNIITKNSAHIVSTANFKVSEDVTLYQIG